MTEWRRTQSPLTERHDALAIARSRTAARYRIRTTFTEPSTSTTTEHRKASAIDASMRVAVRTLDRIANTRRRRHDWNLVAAQDTLIVEVFKPHAERSG